MEVTVCSGKANHLGLPGASRARWGLAEIKGGLRPRAEGLKRGAWQISDQCMTGLGHGEHQDDGLLADDWPLAPLVPAAGRGCQTTGCRAAGAAGFSGVIVQFFPATHTLKMLLR